MKIVRHLIISFLAASICACKTGYVLNEDGELSENDALYHGPSNGAHWELRIDDTDNNFTLRKYANASSTSSEYRVSGDYNELNSGFIQLNITSGSTSDIDTNTLTGVRLEDDAFVFSPFADNETELLALIPVDESCPSSSRGNSFILERTASSSNSDFFISELRYSFSNNEAQFTDGVRLPDLETLSEEVRESAECESGIASHGAGTNYLSANSAILEYNNVGANNAYERIVSIRRDLVTTTDAMDSGDYVGFMRTLAAPDDLTLASAECSNGNCEIFSETAADSINKTTAAYQIALDAANFNINGLSGVASALINTGGSEDTFNAICILSNDLVSSSSNTTKVIACHAVDPADSTSTLSVLLVAKS